MLQVGVEEVGHDGDDRSRPAGIPERGVRSALEREEELRGRRLLEGLHAAAVGHRPVAVTVHQQQGHGPAREELGAR